MSDEIRLSKQGEWNCFPVHLQPRASCNEICGVTGSALKVRVTSPPVDDRANRQLVVFLAEVFDVPARDISILQGLKSRHKTVGFRGIDSALLKQKIHNILYH